MSLIRHMKFLNLPKFTFLTYNLCSRPFVVQAIKNFLVKNSCVASSWPAIKYFSKDCCPPPPKCCEPNENPTACYDEVKKISKCPNKCIYLIDVRDKCEVSEGKIKNSMNIPEKELCKAFEMCPDDFKCKYGKAKPSKDKEIIFYSNTNKRSSKAMKIAKKLCFKYTRQYKGGYKEWKKKESC